MQVLQLRADASQLMVALQGFNPTGNVGAGGSGGGGEAALQGVEGSVELAGAVAALRCGIIPDERRFV